jgi:cobalt-zinc-cadmium efflux system outer membrane protein
MIRRRTRCCILLVAALMSGCASTRPGSTGFEVVRDAVAQRIGQRIMLDPAADGRASAAIDALLHGELTASGAVSVALLRNQGLRATYEDLGIAQAQLAQAGLLANPHLQAEVRFPKYKALPYDIDIAQSFLDLLELPLRQRAAGAALAAAQARVTNEVLRTAADVEAQFYRAQGAAQQVELREAALEAMSDSLEAAQRLRAAGNITDLALASEQAEYETAKIALARAQREAIDAHEALSELMGVWGADTQWTVAPRLPEVPAEQVALAGLESLAIGRRADVAGARAEVDEQLQRLGLARYAPWGDVSIGGHVEKETDDALSIGPTIDLPLPIFDQGQAISAAARARLEQSRRRLQAVAVTARSQVRRAYNAMVGARETALYYQRIVIPLRVRIVGQMQLQTNAMQVSLFALLTAKQAQIDAGRDYVQALQDYWVARADLEKALGGSLPESTTPAATQPAAQPSAAMPSGANAGHPATKPSRAHPNVIGVHP